MSGSCAADSDGQDQVAILYAHAPAARMNMKTTTLGRMAVCMSDPIREPVMA